MEDIIVPNLGSEEEEAEFWDHFDTAEYMGDSVKWFTFEIAPRQDRCDSCGSIMYPHSIDLHLANGYITLHKMRLYVCSICGRSKLAPEVQTFLDDLEALIHQSALGRQPVEA